MRRTCNNCKHGLICEIFSKFEEVASYYNGHLDIIQHGLSIEIYAVLAEHCTSFEAEQKGTG